MTDFVLVVLIIALTCAFFLIVVVRTLVAEHQAGTRGIVDRRARPPLIRRLDLTGVVITVLVAAAVVIRIVNTVGTAR